MQSYQIANRIFHRNRTKILSNNFFWKHKRPQTAKTIMRKKNGDGEIRLSLWLQAMLQSYSCQDNMVLAQKQKYSSISVQDRKPRGKLMHGMKRQLHVISLFYMLLFVPSTTYWRDWPFSIIYSCLLCLFVYLYPVYLISWPWVHEFTSGLSVLYRNWAIFLFLYQYHIVLMTVGL